MFHCTNRWQGSSIFEDPFYRARGDRTGPRAPGLGSDRPSVRHVGETRIESFIGTMPILTYQHGIAISVQGINLSYV